MLLHQTVATVMIRPLLVQLLLRSLSMPLCQANTVRPVHSRPGCANIHALISIKKVLFEVTLNFPKFYRLSHASAFAQLHTLSLHYLFCHSLIFIFHSLSSANLAGTENCTIDRARRNWCPYCRLMKCFSVNMNKYGR